MAKKASKRKAMKPWRGWCCVFSNGDNIGWASRNLNEFTHRAVRIARVEVRELPRKRRKAKR